MQRLITAFDRLRIGQKGMVLVLFPLLLQLGFIGLVAELESVHRRQRAVESLTQQASTAGYELLSLMIDTETAMRGYALTGNEVFLEPYNRAIALLPQQLKRLATLNAGSGISSSEVAARSHEALAFETSMLMQLRRGTHEEVLRAMRTLEGKRRMDAFRSAIGRFIAAHEQAAAAAERTSRKTAGRIYAAFAATAVADLLIAGALAFIFGRSITLRLGILAENTAHVGRGETLEPALAGGDEIALLDQQIHEMARTITATKHRLEKAYQEMEAFSYSISHDLRSPLRAIAGYATIIEEDYRDLLDAEGRRFLATIRSEGGRMGRLIDDLLVFFRLTRTELGHEMIDIAEIARDVINELRRDGTDTEFRIEGMPKAYGDRNTIRQVLLNYLSNAVKYSRNAGSPLIELGGRNEDDENIYWVRDNGAGFDMKYAGKLFGVFQRLHTQDQFEGTGVGLAIVKRIIDKHGGRVWAESSPGAGASFFFTLPARSDKEITA